MKKIKLIVLSALALNSASLYAQGQISTEHQKTIEQAVFCQTAPKEPQNIALYASRQVVDDIYKVYDEKLIAHINTINNTLKSNSSGTPKEEMIDYSNYTTYTLKQPITIEGIEFHTIKSIDYEDGYHTFQALASLTSNDSGLTDRFKADDQRFSSEAVGNKFTISCNMQYSINLNF